MTQPCSPWIFSSQWWSRNNKHSRNFHWSTNRNARFARKRNALLRIFTHRRGPKIDPQKVKAILEVSEPKMWSRFLASYSFWAGISTWPVDAPFRELERSDDCSTGIVHRSERASRRLSNLCHRFKAPAPQNCDSNKPVTTQYDAKKEGGSSADARQRTTRLARAPVRTCFETLRNVIAVGDLCNL